MVGFVGSKVGMTSAFDENGSVLGVSVIRIEDNLVLGVKTKASDGYSAVQLGYGQDKKEKRKAVLGQYKKTKNKPPKKVKEFRFEEGEKEFSVGSVLSLKEIENFKFVNVKGTSIGKGFQGVVKRWNMRGGPKTHGSGFHRMPGSIGNCSDPARVFKGKKMPGRMGGGKVMVKNLQVIKVDVENKLLLVKGGIPGFKSNYVYITKGDKA